MLRTVYGIKKRYEDGFALLCESRGDAEAIAEAMFAYGHDRDEAVSDYVREVRLLAQHPAESREMREFLAGLFDDGDEGDGLDGGDGDAVEPLDEGDGGDADGDE